MVLLVGGGSPWWCLVSIAAPYLNRTGAVMNSLTIINLLLPLFTMYAGYRLGLEVGFDRGNVHGRRTINKQRERVGK
jgi:hypothetical protein